MAFSRHRFAKRFPALQPREGILFGLKAMLPGLVDPSVERLEHSRHTTTQATRGVSRLSRNVTGADSMSALRWRARPQQKAIK
jgi:hypothetical protein